MKVGLVDTEIIGLSLKKEKLRKVKYIARSASLPKGLKIVCFYLKDEQYSSAASQQAHAATRTQQHRGYNNNNSN